MPSNDMYPHVRTAFALILREWQLSPAEYIRLVDRIFDRSSSAFQSHNEVESHQIESRIQQSIVSAREVTYIAQTDAS